MTGGIRGVVESVVITLLGAVTILLEQSGKGPGTGFNILLGKTSPVGVVWSSDSDAPGGKLSLVGVRDGLLSASSWVNFPAASCLRSSRRQLIMSINMFW